MRDISASMFGDRAQWASSLALRLVGDVARKARMRVGYVEFNERPFRLSLADADGGGARAKRELADPSARRCLFTGEAVSPHADDAALYERAVARALDARRRGAAAVTAGLFTGAAVTAAQARERRAASRFFTRDYDGLCAHAANLWCDGLTNYEAALADVLAMYDAAARLGMRGGRHVVFVTDGHPTHGSATLARERRRACALGVCVHPVFIGDGAYPPVLATLAAETGGARFQALPDARRPGVLTLVDFGRDASARLRVAERRRRNARAHRS